jgi:glycosyltransferase involved in cell wall biosynthesis
MKLSILIPALDKRDSKKLIDNLNDQVSRYEEVELIVESDDGSMTSGEKRNNLTSLAKGEYICFVDDDDQVKPTYVQDILDNIYETSADVITFNLRFIKDKTPREVWQFGLWPNQRRKKRMCANHLCAWKKSIATRVAWCNELGNWDDHLWFEPIFYAGLAKTVKHIPKILYDYQYSGNVTENQKQYAINFACRYIGRQGLRCFYSEEDPENTILIEVGGRDRYSDSMNVLVRDRNNHRSVINPRDFKRFHTIRWR